MKKDFQSFLGDLSLIYLLQLQGGCVQTVNFWLNFTPIFGHYAFVIELFIHKIIKLERNPHVFIYIQTGDLTLISSDRSETTQ